MESKSSWRGRRKISPRRYFVYSSCYFYYYYYYLTDAWGGKEYIIVVGGENEGVNGYEEGRQGENNPGLRRTAGPFMPWVRGEVGEGDGDGRRGPGPPHAVEVDGDLPADPNRYCPQWCGGVERGHRNMAECGGGLPLRAACHSQSTQDALFTGGQQKFAAATAAMWRFFTAPLLR